MKKNLAFLLVPQASKNCVGKRGAEGKAKSPHQKLGSSHAKMLTLGASPSFGGAQALQFEGLVVKLVKTPGLTLVRAITEKACQKFVRGVHM
jgi:hypothetical protein